jgi:hypothetical protein
MQLLVTQETLKQVDLLLMKMKRRIDCFVGESLAQSVEHITFNDGVDGSNPS